MADHESIYKLALAVVTELTAAGKTVATAESCTGGWIAKAITDVAGSSAVFACGIVSYSNAAKVTVLGVSERTLAMEGAVSEAAVGEMADGVRRLSGADIAVAVSGIAGPDGGTAEKPVGTVWFAWAVGDTAKRRVWTDRQRFPGDRERIRELTVMHALEGVIVRVREP
jgi:nicotinamide-nucleotide amidase